MPGRKPIGSRAMTAAERMRRRRARLRRDQRWEAFDRLFWRIMYDSAPNGDRHDTDEALARMRKRLRELRAQWLRRWAITPFRPLFPPRA
jgi:hypothetical protein